MDMRMIEVALGLALIFALTSLLVTALRELWASAWGSRGKVLQQALTSFLGDNKVLASALMAHPLLTSLSKKQEGGTPSYMGADIVVTSLIASLVETCLQGVRPATPAKFLDGVREFLDTPANRGDAQAEFAADGSGVRRAFVPNPKLLRAMRSLIHGVENDWPGFEARLCAWYDAVTERSIGWFKRKNQVTLLIFGFVVAAAANINPIAIAPRLWQDAPMRQALAAAGKTAGEEFAAANASNGADIDAAALRAARSAIVPAQAEEKKRHRSSVEETERSLQALKLAFEQVLDKPGASASTPVWREAYDGYQQLLALRSALDATRVPESGSFRGIRRQLEADANVDARMKALESVSTAGFQSLVTTLRKAMDAEKRAQSRLLGSVVDAGCRQDTVLPGSDREVESFCERLDAMNSLKSIGLPIGWEPFIAPQVFKSRCVQSSDCWDAERVGNALLIAIGWLITAVAASLGAPFWFDLLSKIGKLRASGAKPSEVEDAGTVRTPPGGSTMALPSEPPDEGGGDGGAADAGTHADDGGAKPGPKPEAPTEADQGPVIKGPSPHEQQLVVSEVRRVQMALGLLGAQLSGQFDAATRQAILEWQRAKGYGETGQLTEIQLDELLSMAPGAAAKLLPRNVPASVSPPGNGGANGTMPLLQGIASGGRAVSLEELGTQKGLAREIQTALAEIGLLDPPADGVFGPVSLWALREFGKAMNAAPAEIVDAGLAEMLLSSEARALYPIVLDHSPAGRTAAAMLKKGYWLCRHPDAVNIVYVEGMKRDGTPNANEPNRFNDLRTLLRIAPGGKAEWVGCWEASTEPGLVYTMKPLDGTPGVARIALGQFKAWSVGFHKGTQPALVQTAPIVIYRDLDKNFRRDEGERVSIASSINQHSGYDAPDNNVGNTSAGCLVGQSRAGHSEFMARCERDARYQANHGYRFMTTVLEAAELGH